MKMGARAIRIVNVLIAHFGTREPGDSSCRLIGDLLPDLPRPVGTNSK